MGVSFPFSKLIVTRFEDFWGRAGSSYCWFLLLREHHCRGCSLTSHRFMWQSLNVGTSKLHTGTEVAELSWRDDVDELEMKMMMAWRGFGWRNPKPLSLTIGIKGLRHEPGASSYKKLGFIRGRWTMHTFVQAQKVIHCKAICLDHNWCKTQRTDQNNLKIAYYYILALRYLHFGSQLFTIVQNTMNGSGLILQWEERTCSQFHPFPLSGSRSYSHLWCQGMRRIVVVVEMNKWMKDLEILAEK